MDKTCKQCGKTFTLTDSEIQFYKSKGLNLPKRCNTCRAENKKNNFVESKATAQKELTQSRGSHKNNRKSPLAIVIALMIIMVGVIFKGPEFFVELNDNLGQSAVYEDKVSDNLGQSDIYEGESAKNLKYQFRNQQYLEDHFEKHKAEFTYKDANEYLEGANRVVNHPEALYKIEAEDGDDVYYLESTNELVIVSTDGYLRTYFKPSDRINYFIRQ